MEMMGGALDPGGPTFRPDVSFVDLSGLCLASTKIRPHWQGLAFSRFLKKSLADEARNAGNEG